MRLCDIEDEAPATDTLPLRIPKETRVMIDELKEREGNKRVNRWLRQVIVEAVMAEERRKTG